MGASSVTGTGAGSAEKSGVKGPSNGRNMFVPQLCPHVVMAGEVDTDVQGVATVYFPEGPLPKSEVNYVVMVTPIVRAEDAVPLDLQATDWYVTKNDVSDHFDNFVITSTLLQAGGVYTGRFMYEVVTVGFGLDITDDNPNTP
jgi:hypothetical protein